METKFFYCKHCGNVVVKFVDSGVVPVCCGEPMTELAPNTTDGVLEKHLPVIERVDDCTIRVKVGSAPHPMLKEHHIRFVYVETEHGGTLRYLDVDGAPEAEVCVCKDKVKNVYAYCNLHGLWKIDVKAESYGAACGAEKKKKCCLHFGK